MQNNAVQNFYIKDIKNVVNNSAVNILYFTNRCNLACTYCYEDLKGRPKQVLSKDQIMEYVDKILERENADEQTLFVLFGGEVTLEWENAVFCMEYAYSKKRNVHFNISTNGIKFLDDEFLKKYKNLSFYKKNMCSLDISFDGIGNKERVFHSGKETTSTMLKVFKVLNENKIKFRLRYTIHSLNCDFIYDDITNIIKYIKPDRVITSVAWSTLTKDNINNLYKIKEKFRHDWKNEIINIPICEFFCDMCNGCSVQKEIKSYFSDEGNVKIINNNENAKVFSDFKTKE